MNKFLFIIAFCISCFASRGQDPLFKNLSIKTQFPFTTIYDIYQAKNGVIWIGSEEGLVRYSGANTTLHKHQNIAGKAVTNIMEGVNGVIWCQNFSGQILFARNDSVIAENAIPSSGNYRQAAMLHQKILVSCYNDGIVLFNTVNKSLRKIKMDISNIQTYIDEHDDLFRYFSMKDRLAGTIDSSGKISKINLNNMFSTAFYASTFRGMNIMFSKDNPIVFSFGNRTVDESFKDLFKNKVLNNIRRIDNNRFALLSSNGFHILDSNLRISEPILADANTSCIIKDRNDNIWVGTLNNGLYIIPSMDIKKYYADISYNVICRYNGEFVAGSNKNILQFLHPKKFTTTKTVVDPIRKDINTIFSNPYKDELLYCNYQLNVISNGKKNGKHLLLAVNGYDMADSNHYLFAESGALSIYPVTADDKWKAWLADKSRVVLDTRLILNYNSTARVKSVAIIGDTIFASTGVGLFKYYKNGNSEILWKGKSISSLQLNKIGKELIIATSDVGILKYNSGKVTSFINKEKGLAENQIYSVKVFNDTIYALLYSGLDVYTKKGQRVLSLVRSDGFLNVDISDFTICEGQMVAATTDGIITFPLRNSLAKLKPPILLITKVYVNQEEVAFTANMELKSNQRNIDIDIEDLDYLGIQPNKLFYKVNDGKWVPFKNNKIGFNEMAYGDYEISFKAINERNVEAICAQKLSFRISPPFYRTWWFLGLILLATIGLLLLGFRYRIQQIEIKNKLEKDKINLEKALHKSTLASIKSQMNPHFLFNALNTIQSYIYMNDKKTAADYLVNFSELTRLILESSNQEKIYLSEELKTIQLYLKLEKMRFEEDFEYEVLADGLDADQIKIPSMLIQPYIENAIKHGLLHKVGKKLLKVSFELKDKNLIVTIVDNGIGIAASEAINKSRSQAHQSFASKANQKRFELLNELNENTIGVETIHLTNNLDQATGTKIVLTLPL